MVKMIRRHLKEMKEKEFVGHKTNNGEELSRLAIPAHTTSPPRRHCEAQ